MGVQHQILPDNEDAEARAQAIVEAMYAGAAADGNASFEEMETLRSRLDEHPLFSSLGVSVRARLLRAAIKNVDNAESPADHARSIAAQLVSRVDRMLAYTLACEVCACDETMSEGEVFYLESLQNALAIPDAEAEAIFQSARSEGSVRTIDEQIGRMGRLLPHALDAMALMALADSVVTDDEIVSMETVVRRIRDVSVMPKDEMQQSIRAAFDRVSNRERDDVLGSIANAVRSTGDRYWIVVYMLVVALSDGNRDWRESELLARVGAEFHIAPETLEAAQTLARQFVPRVAATRPRTSG